MSEPTTKPPSTDPPTPAELVEKLRAKDPATVSEALAQLFKAPLGAILVLSNPLTGELSFNASGLDAQGAFVQLLIVLQNVAASLGLKLEWVPKKQNGPGLIIPSIPGRRPKG